MGDKSNLEGMDLSANAEETVLSAGLMSIRASQKQSGTGHFLLAVLELGRGSAYRALADLCRGIDDLQRELQEDVRASNVPEVLGAGLFSPQKTPLHRSVSFAMEYARRQKHRHLRTGHLLLGVLHESECWAAQRLAKYGVTFESAHGKIESLLSDG